MHDASRFIFLEMSADLVLGRLVFPYRMEFSDGTCEDYTDTVVLQDVSSIMWERVPQPALWATLQALHLALGINYWKLYCPPVIKLEGFALSPEQALFWDTVYTKGLGEFFFCNTIDFRGLVHFPGDASTTALPVQIPHTGRILVPWGGGKDSAVTAELLKAADLPFDLFSCGEHPLQQAMAARIQKSLHTIVHTTDPLLITRSNDGSAFTGHIPYTAIYTFTSLLVAIAQGYESVIFSNERSANIGNVTYLGATINHQWSKSAEFENMVRSYIKHFITPDIQIFSLLRPFYEIEDRASLRANAPIF